MNRLEVTVGKNTITAANLPKFMETCYKVIADNTSSYENPRPYYEAVKGAFSKNDLCEHYESELNNLGKVDFYIMRNPHNRDRVIAMRSPMMVVKPYNLHSQKGFAAVFVCDDEIGNELLRMTEPPTHSNWEQGRVSDKTDPAQRKASAALAEVKNFMTECITQFFFTDLQDESDFMGVEELLYSVDVETEAAPANQEIQTQSQSADGKNTGETVDTVTSSPTTSLKPETPDFSPDLTKQNKIGQVSIKKRGKADKNPNGDHVSGNSDKPRKTKDGGGVGSPKPKERNTPKEDGNDGSYQVPFPVTYRCYAQYVDGENTYTLKFKSDRDADKGIINIYVVGVDSEEEIPLSWVSKGIIRGNAIYGVKVKEGQNVLQFRFTDSIKHAVYLKVYEEI